ncbi:trp operon leader peptide [Yersinia aldovae]
MKTSLISLLRWWHIPPFWAM